MKDSINSERTEIKLPEYKGHTVITLVDVNTGEQKVVEEDNLVTNAVKDFFSENAFGLFNLNDNNLVPIRNMFGGVLCFQNSITESASSYDVPSESSNPLIAHAGQTGHNTPSTKRGNPNGSLSGETQDGKGYKFVWDFSTSQGNGQISTVCLTHKVAGDLGTLPIAEFNEHPIKRVDNQVSWALTSRFGTRAVAINTPTFFDVETRKGISLYFSATNKLEIIEVEGSSSNFGINNEAMKFVEKDSHEVTVYRNGTTAFSDTYTSIFRNGNDLYIYGLASTNATTVYYAVVNLETYAVTNGTWVLPKKAYINVGNKMWKTYPRYPFNNGKLYLPAYDAADNGNFTFLRFDITNASTCELLQDSNIETSSWVWDNDNRKGISPLNVNDDLIVGGAYMINSGKVRSLPVFNATANAACAPRIHGKSTLLIAYDSTAAMYNGASLNPYYLATINVLSNPVTKQANQTMKIEYTITEA